MLFVGVHEKLFPPPISSGDSVIFLIGQLNLKSGKEIDFCDVSVDLAEHRKVIATEKTSQYLEEEDSECFERIFWTDDFV